MPTTPDITSEQLKARLIEELNLSDLPQHEQDLIISRFSASLMERVTVAVMSQLNEQDFAQISSMFDAGEVSKAQEMIAQKVPNASDIADTVMVEGIAEFKAMIEQSDAEAGQQPGVSNSVPVM
jgi:hypothetical protein